MYNDLFFLLIHFLKNTLCLIWGVVRSKKSTLILKDSQRSNQCASEPKTSFERIRKSSRTLLNLQSWEKIGNFIFYPDKYMNAKFPRSQWQVFIFFCFDINPQSLQNISHKCCCLISKSLVLRSFYGFGWFPGPHHTTCSTTCLIYVHSFVSIVCRK